MKKAIQPFWAVMWGMIIVIFSSCSVFITSLVLFMVTQYGGEWLIVRELLLVNIMQQYLMPIEKQGAFLCFQFWSCSVWGIMQLSNG